MGRGEIALGSQYLRFVKGVVDAQDLSLNVSREIQQQDRQIRAIRRRLTKKVLSMIKDLHSERPQDYRTVWTQFGKVLEEGLLSELEPGNTAGNCLVRLDERHGCGATASIMVTAHTYADVYDSDLDRVANALDGLGG